MDQRPIQPIESRGAALITALGLLFIFSMLGMAYVDYVSITLDTTHYEQRQLRARTLAAAGIQACIGEIQQAFVSGKMEALLASPQEIQIPLYGPNRRIPKGFVLQSNRLAVAKVTVTEEHGPLAEAAAKGLPAPPRCYRLSSESALSDLGPGNRAIRATHARAEAVVAFGKDNTPRTIYWNEVNQ